MSTKDYSSKQEKMVADLLGCKLVVGSGARPCLPGDAKSDKWLCECKTHTKPGHKILFSYEVWEKIVKESIFSHRSPILVVDDGSQNLNKTWCVFPPASVNQDLIRKIAVEHRTRTNIIFDHEEMQSKYVTAGDLNNELYVFEIHWGKYFVYMCPIKWLARICEEDR